MRAHWSRCKSLTHASVTPRSRLVAMSDAVGLPELLDVVAYNFRKRVTLTTMEHFRTSYSRQREWHHYAAWRAVENE